MVRVMTRALKWIKQIPERKVFRMMCYVPNKVISFTAEAFQKLYKHTLKGSLFIKVFKKILNSFGRFQIKFGQKSSKIRRKNKKEAEIHFVDDHKYETLQLKPTLKENIFWLILSASNFLIFCFDISISIKLYKQGMEEQKFLTLLGEYDDGMVYSYLVVAFIALAAVCLYGFVSTNNLVIRTAAANARVPPLSYITALKFSIAFIIAMLIITQLLVLQANDIAGDLDRSIIEFSLDVSKQKKLQVMQVQLKCCGYYSYKDYFRVTWSEMMPKTQFGVPKSCCLDRHHCTHIIHPGSDTDLTIKKKGCKKVLNDILHGFFTLAFKGLLINFFLFFVLYFTVLTNLGSIRRIEAVLMDITIKEAKEAVEKRRFKQKKIAEQRKIKRRAVYQMDYLKRKAESDKAKKERMVKIAQELITDRLKRGGTYGSKA